MEGRKLTHGVACGGNSGRGSSNSWGSNGWSSNGWSSNSRSSGNGSSGDGSSGNRSGGNRSSSNRSGSNSRSGGGSGYPMLVVHLEIESIKKTYQLQQHQPSGLGHTLRKDQHGLGSGT